MGINIDRLKHVTTPSFKGYNYSKSENGLKEYKFNYPFDSNKYDCYLEVYSVEKNPANCYEYNIKKDLFNGDEVNNRHNYSSLVKIEEGGTTVNLGYKYSQLSCDEPFAYRYRLVNKRNNNDIKHVTDPGIERKYPDGSCFNIVMQNGTKVSKGGAMTLIFPDSYYPGYEYDENGKIKEINKEIRNRALNSNRTFSNRLGGTLAGVEKNINRIKEAGYSRIVSTPIFTNDSVSSHSYWNKNCMQMSSAFGNIDNYASFQKTLFKNGINFVSDGAFVNEGLEGVHFRHMLKWGVKSPYYHWFRAGSLKSGPLSMGVFSKNNNFIQHKIVNSPYKYEQDSNGQVKISKNSSYNPKKATYVQIFDNRLVSDEQRTDTQKLIKSYAKTNTDNPYDINTHNDTIIPYSFEINPNTYNSNIKKLNEHNKKSQEKIMLNQPLAAKFLTQSETYVLEDKFENGFETWDANTDIPKLNFVYSHADTKSLQNLPMHEREYVKNIIKQKNCETQDYVVNSGKYWTRKTNEILTEYAANTLKGIDKNPDKVFGKIKDLISKGELPKGGAITKKVVENVLNGDYESKIYNVTNNYKDLVLQSIMDLPLDSIEFADDVVAALGSSLITNRAAKPNQIGMSRYELYKAGNPQITDENKATYKNAEKIFTEDLSKFTDEILQDVNKKLNGALFNSNEVSKLGKYVIPIISKDIAKFALIKSLAPDAKTIVNKENGTISYDYESLRDNVTLQSLGILPISPKDEADLLTQRIRKGFKRIYTKDKDTLKDTLVKRLSGLNANSFALAEMIIDRNDAGLDWRIDASKDIADVDAVRNGNTSGREAWTNIENFWKRFTNSVLKENKNSYIVAEMTNEGDVMHGEAGIAVKHLLQKSGMTSLANYSYYFSSPAAMFGYGIENGKKEGYPRIPDDKSKEFFYSAPLDSILHSYTFVDNHDKPRMLHCLALNMKLFYANFNDGYFAEERKRAAQILKADMFREKGTDGIDFNKVNNKAIAMADSLWTGMMNALDAVHPYSESDNENAKYLFKSRERRDKVCDAILKSISDLAQGKYLGKSFAADVFGAKPFDVNISSVLNQAEKEHGFKFTNEERNVFFNESFKQILEPAMSKFKDMMSVLVNLPGQPTMYAGDDIGETGFEEKTKNVYIQNRNVLHWEWLNDKSKQFVKDFNRDINKIMALRNNPKLQPLNDGTPYLLSYNGKTNTTSILRQSANGKMTISLINGYVDEKYFKPDGGKLVNNELNIGGIGLEANSLKEGTVFKNIDENDKNTYRICKGDDYYIQCYNQKGEPCDIQMNKRTMTLYYDPKENN